MRALLFFTAWAMTPVAAADILDDYVSLRTGSFTSAAQAARDDRYDTAIWHIAEIWPSEAGPRWLYTESWLDGADRPYMQRITRIRVNDAGEIIASRFRVADAKPWLDAWKPGATVPGREQTELIELPGCDGVMVRAGERRFEGGTVGNRCRNGYKGAQYTVSRAVVASDVTSNWDRGFDAQGKQVWGPAHGGYRFRRLGEEHCAKPVRMLVYGTISDRSRFGAYGRALAQSGLYPRYGGYYEASSPPLAVFEGEPDRGRGVIVARFPCLQAAKDFWYSDEYQAIKPLRDGLAEFEVTVLPEPPVPDYVDWQ